MKNKLKAALWFSPVMVVFLGVPAYFGGIEDLILSLVLIPVSVILVYCIGKAIKYL